MHVQHARRPGEHGQDACSALALDMQDMGQAGDIRMRALRSRPHIQVALEGLFQVCANVAQDPAQPPTTHGTSALSDRKRKGKNKQHHDRPAMHVVACISKHSCFCAHHNRS